MALRIKICGMTSARDARQAVDCGADMVGFVFYPKSPRYITPAAAAAIIRELPADVEKVGVFVNEPASVILAAAETAGLTALQLHGSEPPDLLAQLPGYHLIKMIALATAADLERLAEFADATILIDTPCPQWGGSGATGDWSLARAAAARRQVILAGGLTPENVSDAIRSVRPAGIDVVSGVEMEKGIKDAEKVKRFIAAARAAGEEL